VLDVISPCVQFNNIPNPPSPTIFVREHNDAVNRIDFHRAERRNQLWIMRRALWKRCASTMGPS